MVVARTPQLGRLPQLLKALVDPTRLRIVGYLAQRELCVCDLEQVLGISQSMTSHHLGVLRRAGLLLQRREESDNRLGHYRLKAEAVEAPINHIKGVLHPSDFYTPPPHLH